MLQINRMGMSKKCEETLGLNQITTYQYYETEYALLLVMRQHELEYLNIRRFICERRRNRFRLNSVILRMLFCRIMITLIKRTNSEQKNFHLQTYESARQKGRRKQTAGSIDIVSFFLKC